MAEQEKELRPLANHEMLCRFGCGCIVSKELTSCEMCCAEAIAERGTRLAEKLSDAAHKAEEKAERLRALLAKRKAARENRKLDREPAPEKPAKKAKK